MKHKDLARLIIKSLREDPEQWEFTEYWSIFDGKQFFWIANRPYADISVGRKTFGSWWQRRKIRRLMDEIRFSRVAQMLAASPTQDEVDTVVRRIL